MVSGLRATAREHSERFMTEGTLWRKFGERFISLASLSFCALLNAKVGV